MQTMIMCFLQRTWTCMHSWVEYYACSGGLADPNPRVVRQSRVVALIPLETPRLGMNRVWLWSRPQELLVDSLPVHALPD